MLLAVLFVFIGVFFVCVCVGSVIFFLEWSCEDSSPILRLSFVSDDD